MSRPVALAALAAATTAACLDAPPGALGFDGSVDPRDAAGLGDAGLDPALHARYRFDGSLEDSSGNQHDARCSAGECPAFIVDKERTSQAAAFDGLDDLVTLDAAGQGPFTVMGWLRLDDDGDGDFVCPINRPFGQAGANSWQVCFRVSVKDQRQLFFNTADAPRNLVATVELLLTSWYHVAIRWDGSQKTIWWDGALVAVGDATTQFDESEIRLGSDLDGEVVVARFLGALDDVEIWRGALLEDAIREAAGL